jgi:DNA-binding winged helix-turn-helix (wHTH) protein
MMSDSNPLEGNGGIDLAHEPGFSLGRLTVRPDLRQLVRADDGAEEIVEPRVLQVLVALARVRGAIVTRDDLVRDCWDGRIVGEDAINRALSRVRRIAEGIGRGSFTLETVTKVGYRLVETGAHAPAAPATVTPPRRFPRRGLILGGAALGALALAGGGYWLLGGRDKEAAPSPEIAGLMQQAMIALSQDTREGQNQAIGLYSRVVALDPDYADGWGALGNAYATAGYFRPKPESDALRERARAAGRRALALDPGNGYGQVALATARPLRGWWLANERALLHAVAQHPDNGQLLFALLGLYLTVGRIAEALPLIERIEKQTPSLPDLYFFHITILWGMGRLEEADRLAAQAASVFPTHFAIWFTRFYMLMFSGRPSAAIALAEDRTQRPTGIPQSEFDSIVSVARAMQSRAQAEIDAVVKSQLALAHKGAGYAENAMQFAAALGRVDTAFAIADAYYFGRGFDVPELRFSPEQGTYTPLGDRLTGLLFKPSTRAMRSDPRFDVLVGELGLKTYWAESGHRPDYLARDAG